MRIGLNLGYRGTGDTTADPGAAERGREVVTILTGVGVGSTERAKVATVPVTPPGKPPRHRAVPGTAVDTIELGGVA
ncbi:MAG TPA: hypothetical protein VG674_22250 [Amycolatopsis sp.]|nr:hypothetical protein [Amycolatopsis sp.]